MAKRATLEELTWEQFCRNNGRSYNNYKNAVWITKEGKEIELSKMSDTHLKNAIRLLLKNIKKYRETHSSGPMYYDEGERADMDRCFQEVMWM